MKLIKKNIKIKILGNINKFPKSLKNKLKKAEKLTKENKKIQINIALNYGSKEEIIRSVKKIFRKKILINEKRLLYTVEQGDYLGRIAKEYDVKIYEIKNWNNLTSSKLSIGKKLVLYVKDKTKSSIPNSVKNTRVYIVQRGDTLWGIAKKFDGLSVRKIKSLNNLLDDHIKLGTKIIIPTI